MTVNELIAELQVLAAQGYGELDVAIYKDDWNCWTTDIEPTYFKPTAPEFGYTFEEEQIVKPHIIIDTASI